MKKNIKNKIKKRFKEFEFKKIILYKNPNEFCKMYIERVNPNHVGILWGTRRKKFNKGNHFIKFGKVYFSIIPIAYGLSVAGWLDVLTGYTFKLLMSIGIIGCITIPILSYMIFILPFKLGDNKCLMC